GIRERHAFERDHASSSGTGGVANAGMIASRTPMTGSSGSVGASSGLYPGFNSTPKRPASTNAPRQAAPANTVHHSGARHGSGRHLLRLAVAFVAATLLDKASAPRASIGMPSTNGAPLSSTANTPTVSRPIPASVTACETRRRFGDTSPRRP